MASSANNDDVGDDFDNFDKKMMIIPNIKKL